MSYFEIKPNGFAFLSDRRLAENPLLRQIVRKMAAFRYDQNRQGYWA